MHHRMTPDLAVSAGLPDATRFPQTEEEASKIELALAKELEGLSLEEHEKVIFDLHGFNHVVAEDAETMAAQLEELERLLDKIPDNSAYMEAKIMNTDYVRSKFLIYLRSELYDLQLTAEKIIQHFDVKREYFGNGEILARDIRLSDLTPQDMKNLETGFIQLSPVTDSAGRPIIFMGTSYEREGFDPTAMNRALLYYGTTIANSEIFQRLGLVYVFYNYRNMSEEFSFMEPVYRVERSLPVRLVGGHYCYTDETLRPFVSGIQAFIPQQDRFRFRQHLGTPDENEFALQTYGIPTHVSPMQKDGTWSTTLHLEWLRTQRYKEENEMKKLQAAIGKTAVTGDQTESEEIVTSPGRFDVLLGKSTKCREHTGNRRASHLCDMFFDKYEIGNRAQKTQIAERIVQMIYESGGRFLQWEGKRRVWVEVDDDLIAHRKISHFFRYKRFKQQLQSDESEEVAAENETELIAHSKVGALLDSQSDEKRSSTATKRLTPPPNDLHTDAGAAAPLAKRKLDEKHANMLRNHNMLLFASSSAAV